MSVIYKFNNGRGAVLCRQCRVIIDEHISHAEALEAYEGNDLCIECEKKNSAKAKKHYERR